MHGELFNVRQRAIEVRLLLLQGDIEVAEEMLRPVAGSPTLEIVSERVRLALLQGDVVEAERLLQGWPDHPSHRSRLIRLLWSAAIADLKGDERTAIEHVATVVHEVESEEHIGLFVYVGRPVLSPVRALYRVAPSPFLRRVLETPFVATGQKHRSVSGLLQPLTEQETVVLGYLPSRLSNLAIANEIGVSLNTLKTHLKHIYQKLEVTSRAEAIDVAERENLL